MAIGVIGKKSGMTRVFTAEGESIPVTVILAEPNRITQVKTEAADGYNAVQVTTGSVKSGRVTRPMAGHFAKAETAAGRGLWEFRLQDAPSEELAPGAELAIDQFEKGQVVDVAGVSKGKGYAGTIKRWNFRGQDATHGNSISQRAPRLYRSVSNARPRIQGQEDGRSYGQSTRHRSKSHRRRYSSRKKHPPYQGRRARRCRYRCLRATGGESLRNQRTSAMSVAVALAQQSTHETAATADAASRRRAIRSGVRPAFQRASSASGGGRLSGRRPAGHESAEDAQRSTWRRPQALAPEKHRAGTRRLHPQPTLARRRASVCGAPARSCREAEPQDVPGRGALHFFRAYPPESSYRYPIILASPRYSQNEIPS